MGLSQSLWTGLTSIKSHQSWTDVVGNNLAQANTDGFKYSDVSFTDVLYNTISAGANENGGRGSINPSETGLGVAVNSVTQVFKQGDLEMTDNTFDCAIDGDSFFVVGGLSTSPDNYYTRNGRFYLSAPLSSDPSMQHLQTADGLIVQGYQATDGVLSDTLTNITLPSRSSRIDGNPTTELTFSGNLDSDVTVAEGNAIATSSSGTTSGSWISNTGTTINVGAVETSGSLYDGTSTASGTTDLTNLEFDRGSGNTGKLFANIPSGYGVDSRELSVTFTKGGHTYTETFTYGNDGTTLDDLTTWLTGGVGDAGTPDTQRIEGGAFGTVRTKEYTLEEYGYAAPAEQAGGYYAYDDSGNFSLSIASNLGKFNTISDIYITTTTKITNASTGETRNLQESFDDFFQPNRLYPEDSNAGSTTSITEVYLPSELPDVGTIEENERVHYTLVSRDSNGSTWRWYADSDYQNTEEADLNKGTGIIRFSTSSQTGQQQVVDSTVDGGTTLTMNFDDMTQLATDYSTNIDQDGCSDGELESYTIDQYGIIDGVYSNGLNQNLARIGLAVIPNATGLTQAGNTLWTTNGISGDAIYNTTVNIEMFGNIRGNYIETSNVDMANEMTKLLMSQRGYQLGSKVITTSDDMLKEAANLKR